MTSFDNKFNKFLCRLAKYGYGPESCDLVKIVMIWLRNLKAFVSYASKWGNDVHLTSTINSDMDGSRGSLLVRIGDAVRRTERKMDSFRLFCESFRAYYSAFSSSYMLRDIKPLEEEIDEWYITWLHSRRQPGSLTADEVLEIIDSILENLANFLSLRTNFYRQILGERMEALLEQMTFWKNFVRFAIQRNVEHRQMEDLLAQIEAFAIEATHLLFFYRVGEFDGKWCKKMHRWSSLFLQKNLKRIDLQVYDIYARALRSSKFSRRYPAPTQNMEDDTTITMKNFLDFDFLISCFWEMLQLDTGHVPSSKDQFQVLYEGLRFLRTVLKQQSNTFDEKIRYDIGDVVCDAAILICSFYQTHAEVDVGLPDVLERIKVIRAGVEEQVPQTSIFNFPRINEQGFIDFLLENLMELISGQAEPIAKSPVQTIQEELVFLRTFLGEIAELRNEQEQLQALWDRVVVVAYRVEILIDHILVGGTSDSFSMLCDSIIEEMGSVKTQTLKIFYGKKQDIGVKDVSTISSHVPWCSPSITNEVVGLHDEATTIMDRLTRGSKQLRIIAIVGMPGLGKTTLASKVYNDPSVMCHFSVHAWCPVSQVFNKKRVLLELLSYIDSDRYSEMDEQDLAEKLRHRLKGRRYVIVLDDVWTIEVLKSLEGSFPDDSVGSRIILTSRLHDVAPHSMLDQEPHFLRQLNEDECLELLQKKLFLGRGWPPALHDLGMQIAESSRGLPLTIVIVAGLLATTEQEGWKGIVDGLSSGIVSSTEQCMNTLELSYKHLPDYLKPCLLYLGAFPEDQEFSVRRLIRLWIAEGFVPKTKLKSAEDVAEDYMIDLIGRSLVMVAKQRSTGGVKTCRIHDLLYDFCLGKAKEEHFFDLLKGSDELFAFNESCNLRRLCIHSEPQDFKKAKLFCPRARSLLFFTRSNEFRWIDISFITHIFKLLRVLDLEQFYLSSAFPSEIEFLVQLRYLAISGGFSIIPSSVGKLLKLETFIVNQGVNIVSLPDSLWNLLKLRYLHIKSINHITGGSLPIENLDNNSVLLELDSLSGAIFSSRGTMEKQLRKFPNIRKLKCILFQHEDDTKSIDKVIVPDFLSRLESIGMSPYFGVKCCMTFEFGLPANLKKLTLSRFELPWRNISSIGKLPNLEVLKLLGGSFTGETWEMEDGEFSKLKFLKLSCLDIVRWRASNDQFLCFQKLVLDRCCELEEIPSCLENIPTLEMIEVFACSEATASLVKHIEEEQMDLGNSALKVLIQSSDD